MSLGNGVVRQEPADILSHLRKHVGKLQTVDGGPLYPVRSIPARLIPLAAKLEAGGGDPSENSADAIKLVQELMPTAPPDEIADNTIGWLTGVILLSINPKLAIELYAAEHTDPNEMRGTTEKKASPPETSSPTSATASPQLQDAMSGGS